jgi:acyl dehydratase
MTEYVFWEDIDIGHTAEFGAYAVTREEVIEFATKFDPQPFHLSDEAAAKSLFGKLCASGWHTTAMFMSMMVEYIGDRKGGLGSPGIDELKWKVPVYPGDTLSCRNEVLEKSLSPKNPAIGFIKYKNDVLNQDGVVVMSMVGNAIQMRAPQ